MKTESNIDPIRNLIRDNALEPRPNEWFTQRVMSSLPIKKERRSFSWLSVAFYAVAILSLTATMNNSSSLFNLYLPYPFRASQVTQW